MTYKKLLTLLLSSLWLSVTFGQSYTPAKWGDWQHWGAQPDGRYLNPVLPADYSDIDCIRVGNDYCAISSTFQYSPGVVILHSSYTWLSISV